MNNLLDILHGSTLVAFYKDFVYNINEFIEDTEEDQKSFYDFVVNNFHTEDYFDGIESHEINTALFEFNYYVATELTFNKQEEIQERFSFLNNYSGAVGSMYLNEMEIKLFRLLYELYSEMI